MFRSLRARLLVWYTAMLVLVVAAFGGLVCFEAWRSRVADIDTRLRARANQMAGALRPAGSGTFDLVLPADPIAAALDADPRPYHALWDGTGRIIDRSDPDLDLAAPTETGARTFNGRREVAMRTESGALIVVGRDLADLRADIRNLAATMAAVGTAALVVTLAGGWLLVGRALAPVDRIGRAARRMSDGDFTARIPLDRVETELEQLGGAINDAFATLCDSLEQERRFTADASHELRTPLATLLTETETILARDRDAGSYRESLEVCRRAADRMRVVVERLLLLARADAGEVTMARLPVRLDTLTRQVVDDLRGIAAERQVTLVCESEPVTVSGDANRLIDALTNLVTNAIDYNVPDGRVDIRVSARANDAEIRVADTGIGMDESTQTRIFDPFFTTKEVGKGVGLGLSSVAGLVEQCHGHISVESALGRGTTFRVFLPLVEGSASDVAPVALAPDGGRGERVLLVEDEPLVRKLLEQLLTRAGYQVSASLGSDSALELVKGSRPFNIIVTDVVMPGLSGPQLAARIEEACGITPTIFVSGYTEDPAMRASALKPHQRFMSKPFAPEELLTAIRALLAKSP